MPSSHHVPKNKWLTMLERGSEVSSFIQIEREFARDEADAGVKHIEVYVSGSVSFVQKPSSFMVSGVWATDRSGGEVVLLDHEYAQATANLIKAYFTEAGL